MTALDYWLQPKDPQIRRREWKGSRGGVGWSPIIIRKGVPLQEMWASVRSLGDPVQTLKDSWIPKRPNNSWGLYFIWDFIVINWKNISSARREGTRTFSSSFSPSKQLGKELHSIPSWSLGPISVAEEAELCAQVTSQRNRLGLLQSLPSMPLTCAMSSVEVRWWNKSIRHADLFF